MHQNQCNQGVSAPNETSSDSALPTHQHDTADTEPLPASNTSTIASADQSSPSPTEPFPTFDTSINASTEQQDTSQTQTFPAFNTSTLPLAQQSSTSHTEYLPALDASTTSPTQQHGRPQTEPFPAFNATILPAPRVFSASSSAINTSTTPAHLDTSSTPTAINTSTHRRPPEQLSGRTTASHRAPSGSAFAQLYSREQAPSRSPSTSSSCSSSSSSTIKPGQRTPRQSDFHPRVETPARPFLATLFAQVNDLPPTQALPLPPPPPPTPPLAPTTLPTPIPALSLSDGAFDSAEIRHALSGTRRFPLPLLPSRLTSEQSERLVERQARVMQRLRAERADLEGGVAFVLSRVVGRDCWGGDEEVD